MPTVLIGGKKITLKANGIIGTGGEADIYRLDAVTVLKLYKGPSHPDFRGMADAKLGATHRLDEHQRKLTQFPQHLPIEVVSPRELAYDNSGRIVGYTMPYVSGMEVLMRLGQRDYRDSHGIDGNGVIAVFRQLHRIVSQLHQNHVVIGDFNDLNVLSDGTQLRVVDADSMQFGSFACQTFTTRFVDPLRCASDALRLVRPHNEMSDWYAYFVMLLQSFLYVGPYGGVHRPAHGSRLQHDERVLRRITVHHPDVVYPRPALSLDVLPDELRDLITRVFEHDQRNEFPLRMLDAMRWTTCTHCGFTHARARCPLCALPGAPLPIETIRGRVTARVIFRTAGHILQAAFQDGTLRFLYQENGTIYREGSRQVMSASDAAAVRFRLHGNETLAAKDHRLVKLAGGKETSRQVVDTYRDRLPVYDASAIAHVWVSGGQLLSPGVLAPMVIGDVLPDQTLVWTGDHFGLGLYQVGAMTRGFVFRPDRSGINDRVVLAPISGQLIDATCVFSSSHAWLMLEYQHNGILRHRCDVISSKGEALASLDVAANEDHWLAHTIRGTMPSGASLFVATDDGIIRVGAQAGIVAVEREFPDTATLVDAGTYLVPASGGIYAVTNRSITLLQM